MKWKIIIPVAIVSVILLVFIINRVAVTSKNKSITKEPAVSLTPTPTVALLSWDDPAGFSFQYRKGVTIDKHDEDKENYAHVEMTHPDHQGKLIIWAKDTTAADLVAWGKKEKSIASASSIETTLGGIAAKKFSLATPKKMIAAVISDNIVFSVEADTEDLFWQDQFDTITKTFAFTTDSQSSSANGDASSDTAVDEEEVVE